MGAVVVVLGVVIAGGIIWAFYRLTSSLEDKF